MAFYAFKAMRAAALAAAVALVLSSCGKVKAETRRRAGSLLVGKHRLPSSVS